MVNLKAGTNITHVPFKSSGQALIALLGGHVSMQYGGLASEGVDVSSVWGLHAPPGTPIESATPEEHQAQTTPWSISESRSARR